MKPRLGRIALVGAGIIAAAVLVGPFLVPVPPLTGTLTAQALADPDSQFIEINGLSVHVKTMGPAVAGSDKPVFLLLHGFGASLYSWQAVMEPLSRLGTVIAYDRPGFGLTERPLTWQGQNPYGPDAQVALALGLLDHFGVKQAILVGNSAGGAVAMQVALAHPDRVSALVLVDPAVYSGGGLPAWLHPLLTTPQMNHLGPLVARQILSSGPTLIKTAWHDPSKITPETLSLYEKPLRVDHWNEALWQFSLASGDTGLVQHLSELSLPTLVITGDDDRIVPTEQSIRLSKALPNAQLTVIANAGHVPHEEQPAAFMDAFTRFVNQLPS